jgi:4'-phosphopantetheinyl transferase EntD
MSGLEARLVAAARHAGSAAEETQRLLSSLLPSFVECVASDPEEASFDLHPAEEEHVRGAVEKRRREFAAGRACARAALERFGVRDAVLPRSPDRTPCWVDGFTGSITHCSAAVAAAVASTHHVASLGIDIEGADPLPRELRASIATERERARLECMERLAGVDPFKLLFSAKESFFKCHFMVARRMLDFLDVEIAFDAARGRFSGALTNAELRAACGLAELQGRFCIGSRHVFTAVVLDRGARSETHA